MKRIKIRAVILIICAALFSVVSCNNQQPNTEKTKLEKTENRNENTIFPTGEKAPANYFTGTVFCRCSRLKPKIIIFQSPA